MPLFQTCHLCKHYRPGPKSLVRALDDVSLGIDSGSFVLLTGASGSGKTTLLAVLGALERPTQGQVFFDDRDLSNLSGMELARVRRRFGFVFQNFSLIPGLPVWENITYPLIPRGIPSRRRLEIARACLGDLGLEDRLSAWPKELSGGEQQRVAFARALGGRPEVLLADEPTWPHRRSSSKRAGSKPPLTRTHETADPLPSKLGPRRFRHVSARRLPSQKRGYDFPWWAW